jgi:hypothetical protein
LQTTEPCGSTVFPKESFGQDRQHFPKGWLCHHRSATPLFNPAFFGCANLAVYRFCPNRKSIKKKSPGTTKLDHNISPFVWIALSQRKDALMVSIGINIRPLSNEMKPKLL